MGQPVKVQGKHPGSWVYIYQGYSYALDKLTKIYRCSTRSTTGCTGILSRNRNGMLQQKSHNHPPDITVKNKKKLIQKMIVKAKETLVPPKQIFDELCRSNPSVGQHLSYREVRSRLQRARVCSRPRLPHSLKELDTFLQSYKPVKGFYHGIAEANDSCGLLFSSSVLLQELGKADSLFIDGTFAVVPKVPKMTQLYSIHIRVMDVGVAAVFVLTEKRTACLYRAIWTKLFEIVPTLRENIAFIMSDYEKAAMTAARRSFPNAHVHGCWFHFTQALLRRWKKIGLANCPRELLWMGMSLPLASATRFEEGLEMMKTTAKKMIEESPMVRRFMEYLQRTWAPIAETVSVYGCTVRTNNIVESFHSTTRGKLGGVHPNLWTFLEQLQKLTVDQELNLARITAGVNVNCPRSSSRTERDMAIKNTQDQLVHGSISLGQFLKSFYGICQETYTDSLNEA